MSTLKVLPWNCIGMKQLADSWYARTMSAVTTARMWTCGTSLTGFHLVAGRGYCCLMEQIPSPLERILKEIERALVSKFNYLALVVALSIPDICADLEHDQSTPRKRNKDRYEAWCRANLVGSFVHVTESDLYRVRCGVVHSGNFGKPDARYDRIVFVPPGSPVVIHDNITAYNANSKERILVLDLALFCAAVTAAARKWEVKMQKNQIVQANMLDLVTTRPEGLPPNYYGPAIA